MFRCLMLLLLCAAFAPGRLTAQVETNDPGGIDQRQPGLDSGPEPAPASSPADLENAEYGDGKESAYDEIELLAEVMLHIRKNYLEEKSYEEIMAGALHGMLYALDPHSDYLEPEAYSDMKDDTSGRFGGIGIHVGMRDGFLTVIAPIEGTPGFKAGLHSGDQIVEIDGQKTMGISLRDAVKKMRGPKGEKVTLTIRREGEGLIEGIEIIRDNIEVPSVKGASMLRENVGYIRITQFSEPTADSLETELDNLMDKGMKALVLDLRGNPGGLLKSAVSVSGLFLEKKDLIVSTEGRKGREIELRAMGQGIGKYSDLKMAVLVNGGSASASEIVAGALQDNRRAVIVGEKTFGKGSVQSVIRLAKGGGESAIRLTTAHYHTPSGRDIHEKGLEPDIEVAVSLEEWREVQMKRAQIEYPDQFDEEEIEEYNSVVDVPLERAADMLEAVMILDH